MTTSPNKMSEDELRIGKKTLVLDGVNPIRFRFDGDYRLYQFDEDGNIFCVEPVDHIRQPAKKVTTNQEGES